MGQHVRRQDRFVARRVRQRRVLDACAAIAARFAAARPGVESSRRNACPGQIVARVAPVPGPDRVLPVRTPVRPRAASATAAAHASWSGCRSPTHGVTTMVASRSAARGRAASSVRRAASVPSGRPRKIGSTAGASAAAARPDLGAPDAGELGRAWVGESRMRRLAVGGDDQPHRGAVRGRQRDQAAGTERFVVRMGGHDDEHVSPAPARDGRCRRPLDCRRRPALGRGGAGVAPG